ncbi:hypothetical protein MED297_00555 [Reinekea sp. MED297]|uniref:Uncharacterized protein n=2 Tax=Reinekea TaxID=230494 RepID=A4BIC6_9GAMM|nr:hypothetical protein MED297_00555 [Reinekea sp. MED297] [Reinekea blandensis MED297]
MYDWPELTPATTTFGNHLRDALSAAGFTPANMLSTPTDLMAHWQHPDLLLSQTCGLPYSRMLHDRVGLVGTPSYDIPSSAGQYHSVLIVPANADTETLTDLTGACFAVNEGGSQSGFSAPMTAFQQASTTLPNSLTLKMTGSHRTSIHCVANGEADVAGIDAVTWEIACRHEPATHRVRVLRRTQQTPGLPMISALRSPDALHRLHNAVVDAMASLDEATRDALLLLGFNATRPRDYRALATRFSALNRTL